MEAVRQRISRPIPKAGELLAKMERSPKANGGDVKSKNGRQPLPSDYGATLKSAGVNERTARRWQELAGLPKKKFEDALRDPRIGSPG